jgi:hypothetical protein
MIDRIGDCTCESNPLCLMANRNEYNCRLLWATNRAKTNRLRPMMNVVTRQSACEKRGKPGFLIAGQCLNVSRAKVIEHEETIQRKRAAAHTDCRAKGRDTLQETVTWKGQFEYVCDFRGREDDDDRNIACDPGECIDSSSLFGGQCKQSSGCPGGTRICGTAGCP